VDCLGHLRPHRVRKSSRPIHSNLKIMLVLWAKPSGENGPWPTPITRRPIIGHCIYLNCKAFNGRDSSMWQRIRQWLRGAPLAAITYSVTIRASAHMRHGQLNAPKGSTRAQAANPYGCVRYEARVRLGKRFDGFVPWVERIVRVASRLYSSTSCKFSGSRKRACFQRNNYVPSTIKARDRHLVLRQGYRFYPHTNGGRSQHLHRMYPAGEYLELWRYARHRGQKTVSTTGNSSGKWPLARGKAGQNAPLSQSPWVNP